MTFVPSDSQRDLIEKPGSVFVEACPGAGKTQCIVERYIQRPGADQRRGVALLSFTNAAIDEVRIRCSGFPELLLPPNFTGTIDGFINRFIVGPVYSAIHGRAPTLRDSWARLQGTSFRVGSCPGVEFELDWFSFDESGAAKLEPVRVRSDVRWSVRNLSGRQQADASVAAARIWTRFASHGVMDCAAARTLLTTYLTDPALAQRVQALLSSRFSEVIIDEVQDCDSTDLLLINCLLDAGISVVMVGDMDQSIYDFRGSSPAETRKLLERVPQGLRLDGNFRSSRRICAVVDSIRFDAIADNAVGQWADEPHEVRVIAVPSLAHGRTRVIDALAALGLDPSESIVLAHGEKDAAVCAGAVVQSGKRSSNRVVQIAQASHVLQDVTSSARARKDAEQTLSAAIRTLAAEDTYGMTDAAFCDSVGISVRAYRDGCRRLANRCAPFGGPPSVFKDEIVKGVRLLGWNAWVHVGSLRIPPGDAWPESPAEPVDALRFSTIHSFKGLQAPSVAVAIPAGHRKFGSPLHDWLEGHETERRRILYVGVSRAERALLFVVHESLEEVLIECLNRDRIPFVRA
ncbi:UvrD-helicase domain-containing protein [Micromonospora chersina]|uniref:UvrD-helicase domain-containing protein n=1 Tax=Micromonospora chersina TaxID=47854 RepID=UPI00371EAE19